jgi:WD40 repeat protein
MSLTGHDGPILSLIYMNNLHGSLIATTANDDQNSIKVWDLEKRECISTLLGHEDTIKAIIFVKNSKNYFNLISASEDRSIRIWEFEENFTNYWN